MVTIFRLEWGCYSAARESRPGTKYSEKYSNTLQVLSLICDYNYITITGPVEMY